MNAIDMKLEAYMFKAKELGFIKLDKDYILLTDTGKKELENIMIVCFNMIDSSNSTKDYITSAAKAVEQATGKYIHPMDLFKEIMKMTINGTDAKLLAFMMHERDNDYKFLKSALVEGLPEMEASSAAEKKPGKPSLSVVKKPRYDA